MSLDQAHIDIARERFLDLMAANGSSDPKAAAILAIAQADEFRAAYIAYEWEANAPAPLPRLKGCVKCFGSGGKLNNPCKVCRGSGRVAS